jgi:hypothetical protein
MNKMGRHLYRQTRGPNISGRHADDLNLSEVYHTDGNLTRSQINYCVSHKLLVMLTEYELDTSSPIRLWRENLSK